MNKEIIFIIKVMHGGGAERVISLLSHAAAEKGNKVSLILTHQSKAEAVLRDIDERINIISLPDEISNTKSSTIISRLIMLLARFIGKLGFDDKSSVLKYLSRNYSSVSWLKKFFKKHKNSSAIAFLSLLAKNKKTKLIISERSDPSQSSESKTDLAFMKKEFQKADAIVFQSPDVQKWYAKNTSISGTIIFNPIKPDLPELFKGERKKRIVNFCRLSPEKNLTLLFDAFAEFHKDHPDYELDIFGDCVASCGENQLNILKTHIQNIKCNDCIHIFPARNDIHDYIKDYTMFVSSSDFEGMSNSMLEAMAMGLPCVCTDCPAGGARAVIKDGENGLLTPVGDSHALYLAMKKIVQNPELANKISENAAKIRNEQSIKKITKKWMDLIYD